ncbi:MAG: excinuclease ABC subunit UvrC [Candidatus Aminicenantes bacterium]|nr:excinuclease ABC subunit UvrC [Candidatus Aminicenantes bacterium]
MTNRLKKRAQNLPQKAGIYFFKTKTGEVVYIGKARSLRDRVKSYFQQTSEAKVRNILAETHDIDYILTGSIKEAAFLENNFIRRYQPKFNLRLKDDKSFPYLKMTLEERYPALTLTRRVEEDGAKYFGPYSPAHQVRKTIHLISKYFGVRTCEEAIPGKRKRPCLEHDLKLCSAPCIEYISESDYRENVENALLFLEGRTERLLKVLNHKMKKASDQQDFEQAAHWRDLIHTIEAIKERPKFISVQKEDIDIFGFSRKGRDATVFVFFMRTGKVIDSEELFFEAEEDASDQEILSGCLKDFYQSRRDIPKKVLLPISLPGKDQIAKMLSANVHKKIMITSPLKGKNRQLVDMAVTNAQILMRKKREGLSPQEEARQVFGLSSIPHRIEGYDISNTGGDESVGSLVVFVDGLPQKNDYRKYKIKSVKGPDDVASLKEVIKRRYSRVLREKEPLPDLILVDGGKGQLNAAKAVLNELGLSQLQVVSLAKKEEIIFTPSRKDGIRLERTSPALKLFQNIRDEAHRFAISFHRLRRKKKSFKSWLDGIQGIGRKRKAALLAKYRNLEEIKRASVKELAEITGRKAAQSLLNHLKGPDR